MNRGIRRLFTSFLVIFIVLFLVTGSAQAVPTIVPTPLPGAQVGVPYSTTLTAINIIPPPPPYTPPNIWQVVSGSLPPGLTLAPTGTISGTPTTAGMYTFYVTVTDSTRPSLQQGFYITVAPPPITFTYTYLPEATEGISYRWNIAVTGGKAPYTFSLVSGILPSGLTLDFANGIIFGTPAKGTAGTYTITIRVTDSSTPPLSAQRSYSLVVKKGFYESVITIAFTLAAGETNVFADGSKVATLRGGQSTRLSFPVGTKPTISVNSLVSHPTRADVRFVADVAKLLVDELSPDATFTYTPEYFIDVRTDPPQITSLTGSAWYREGSSLKSTAPAQIEGTTGIQYRFSYWLLPNGDKLKGEDISWRVDAPGKVTATYDTYYLLTVISSEGKVDGSGWYKAGIIAKWSINPLQVPMSGILGFFRGKLKPESTTGTEVMDAPKTVTVAWNPDYTMPAVLISLIFLFLGGAGFGVYRFLYPPAPKPAAPPLPPLAPAPPTIVVVEGAPRPRLETTREQLLEQFGQLLQKYEEEVKSAVKPEELPEAKVTPETQRLPLAEVEPRVCTHTAKNLLRTVVGNWWKKEERIITPPPSVEKATEKGISIVTLWARDVYNEWEVFTCSLPRGHSGNHKGATSKTYTLQNTIVEERTYGAKQKITPPKPHFTDELPVVDVTHHQIMDTNRSITPDEVIPPEQP